ncbi:MAG: DUF1700 domain-containing protein [Clostridia bacterium]|nr:DUF1700 domain-containing protein [Clostridia bacterium]
MTRVEFFLELSEKLSGLPFDEIEQRWDFYNEMIDDYIEEGMSEEEAINTLGSVDEIATQILSDVPFSKLVKEKIKPKRRLKWWEIVLLVLGSPIWFSLLIAAFAVIFSLYISLWSVIISLWAAAVSVIACGLGGIVAGIGFAVGVNGLTGIAVIGAGIVCTGLSIFLFYGCKAATKGTYLLTKKLALMLKNSFIKKEEA